MSYPGSGRADHLALGDWNTSCYQCGRKRKASTMARHWQGYYVCKEHWEARQPQDFVRNVSDIQTPPWVQPMPGEIFRYYCTIEGRTGVAGIAVAGCAVAGRPLGVLPTCIPIVISWYEDITLLEDVSACGALIVGATLQLEGIIRIQ